MKKILIIIYIIIFAALIYYVVNLFIDRNQEDVSTENSESTSQITKDIKSEVIPPKIDITETEETANITTTQADSAFQITREDCTNNCDITGNTDQIDYCKQICGLTTTSSDIDSCDDLSELNKDYCLRDEAVAKNDLTICEQITDTGINKQCKNRINENFIDEIMK